MNDLARQQYAHNRQDTLVKKTIEVYTRNRDALPVYMFSVSTAPNNVTSSSMETAAHASLLWIPYVLIALLFIVFLGANFWCYHKKHRERYLRKRDEKRVKDGLHERRRITALMRSHFQSAFVSKENEDAEPDGEGVPGGGEEEDALRLPLAFQPVVCPVAEPETFSPASSLNDVSVWVGQNGSALADSSARLHCCNSDVIVIGRDADNEPPAYSSVTSVVDCSPGNEVVGSDFDVMTRATGGDRVGCCTDTGVMGNSPADSTTSWTRECLAEDCRTGSNIVIGNSDAQALRCSSKTETSNGSVLHR